MGSEGASRFPEAAIRAGFATGKNGTVFLLCARGACSSGTGSASNELRWLNMMLKTVELFNPNAGAAA